MAQRNKCDALSFVENLFLKNVINKMSSSLSVKGDAHVHVVRKVLLGFSNVKLFVQNNGFFILVSITTVLFGKVHLFTSYRNY